jgi:hypothetical protein
MHQPRRFYLSISPNTTTREITSGMLRPVEEMVSLARFSLRPDDGGSKHL